MRAEYVREQVRVMNKQPWDFPSLKKNMSDFYTRDWWSRWVFDNDAIVINYSAIAERCWLAQQEENWKQKPHSEANVFLPQQSSR